jgi:hypothetical protein
VKPTSSAPTSAELVKGIYSLPQGTTLGGLTPPLYFHKGKITPNSCFFYMGIKLTTTKQPTCT